jgi:hypothetical protein
LQFSLRSVLTLTLAVALWLGYEVREARNVEQTVAALRELGGNAECELTGWSLLRLCRVPGYGRRIVRVEILGSAAEEAVSLLRDSTSLREVQVTYDGTYDPAPSWQSLRNSLPNVALSPVAEKASDCEARIASRALAIYFTADVQRLFGDTVRVWRGTIFGRRLYRIVQLPDDSLAELLIGSAVSDRFTATYFAVLVVDDRCVGIRGFFTPDDIPLGILLEDIDGDAAAEVAFEWTDKGLEHSSMRQLSGDSRDWLGVYKIGRDGFKSLLPDDLFDVPEAESIVQSRRIERRGIQCADAKPFELTRPEPDISSAPPARPPGSASSLSPDSER